MKTYTELVWDFEAAVEVAARSKMFAWQAKTKEERNKMQTTTKELLVDVRVARQALYDAMKETQTS